MAEIFEIPVAMFWDNFFADKAKFSFGSFLEAQGEKEIVWDTWVELKEENTEEVLNKSPNSENGIEESKFVASVSTSDVTKLSRQIRWKVNIKGVPFCSSSRWTKDFSATKSVNKIEVLIQVRTPDVPYGDYFYLQERWVIGSTVPNGNKIYFKLFISTQIVKKTMFEKKIQKR